MDATSPLPGQARLFVLEIGQTRPIDHALSQGTHEIKDLGVLIAVDEGEISVSWLGHGPRAFLLPGARQLAKGQWNIAEDRARISWAGRDWLLVAQDLPGSAPVPPMGVSLNANGLGFPALALLVAEQGKDRGNFWRFRTVPTDIGRGVRIVANRAKDGTESLHLRLTGDATPTTLDGQPLAPGSDTLLRGAQLVTVADTTDAPGLQARVLLATT